MCIIREGSIYRCNGNIVVYLILRRVLRHVLGNTAHHQLQVVGQAVNGVVTVREEVRGAPGQQAQGAPPPAAVRRHPVRPSNPPLTLLHGDRQVRF